MLVSFTGSGGWETILDLDVPQMISSLSLSLLSSSFLVQFCSTCWNHLTYSFTYQKVICLLQGMFILVGLKYILLAHIAQSTSIKPDEISFGLTKFIVHFFVILVLWFFFVIKRENNNFIITYWWLLIHYYPRSLYYTSLFLVRRQCCISIQGGQVLKTHCDWHSYSLFHRLNYFTPHFYPFSSEPLFWATSIAWQQ